MKVSGHLGPIVVSLVCLVCSSAWAADPAPAKDAAPAKAATPAKPAAPSKEMREKMALAHDKMAVCLRSDRPVGECRQEMMKSCQELGGQYCNMKGGKHGMKDDHHGMMHGEDDHDMMPTGSPSPKP